MKVGEMKSHLDESKSVVPDLPELTFEEKNHIYRLNEIVIPSVSTIMEPLTAAKYAGVGEKTLNNAADKGTTVHNAIENFIKYQIEDIPKDLKGYFDAFVNWWNEHEVIVIASEARVYHKILQYGGTIDILAYVDGKLTLVDIKTTSALIDMTFGVQLEGYSQALKSLGVQIERKVILHLQKDGKHKVKDYPLNDTQRWRVFGSLKCVYDYIQSA